MIPSHRQRVPTWYSFSVFVMFVMLWIEIFKCVMYFNNYIFKRQSETSQVIYAHMEREYEEKMKKFSMS